MSSASLAGTVDLESSIEKSGCHVLNTVEEAGTVQDVVFGAGVKPLVSSVDAQLLITVPFQSQVKLRALRIAARAGEEGEYADASGPRTVKLFVNQPSLSFEDVDSAKPAQVIELTAAHLAGQPIQLKPVAFAAVRALTVFVADNQAGGDVTRVDNVRFFGQPQDGTDMSKLEKCKDCC